MEDIEIGESVAQGSPYQDPAGMATPQQERSRGNYAFDDFSRSPTVRLETPTVDHRESMAMEADVKTVISPSVRSATATRLLGSRSSVTDGNVTTPLRAPSVNSVTQTPDARPTTPETRSTYSTPTKANKGRSPRL
ncbi:hypothetical protein BGX23_005770, partial [Mortierella sp. AD031]